MILTDREIEAAIQNGQIKVSPPPEPAAYSSTTLDLTLGPQIRLWKQPAAGIEQIVCPAAQGYDYTKIAQTHTDTHEIGADGYVLEPRAFLLAWTREEVDLPHHSRLAARVEGKSSLARLGIGVHITAPTIHSGFSGAIQLEMCNHGTLRVKLMAGMPVCQLIFEQTFGTPMKGYKGQFYGQKGA